MIGASTNDATRKSPSLIKIFAVSLNNSSISIYTLQSGGIGASGRGIQWVAPCMLSLHT